MQGHECTIERFMSHCGTTTVKKLVMAISGMLKRSHNLYTVWYSKIRICLTMVRIRTERKYSGPWWRWLSGKPWSPSTPKIRVHIRLSLPFLLSPNCLKRTKIKEKRGWVFQKEWYIRSFQRSLHNFQAKYLFRARQGQDNFVVRSFPTD